MRNEKLVRIIDSHIISAETHLAEAVDLEDAAYCGGMLGALKRVRDDIKCTMEFERESASPDTRSCEPLSTAPEESAKLILNMQNELAELRVNAERYKAALEGISEHVGAPDISPIGDVEFGLHCGVEDRMCSDRYEGANVGYENGVESALEWAASEAKHALFNG